MGAPSARVDLLIANARHVATLDADRREVADGWVAIDGGRIAEVGSGPPPAATDTLDASDCLVTPRVSSRLFTVVPGERWMKWSAR